MSSCSVARARPATRCEPKLLKSSTDGSMPNVTYSNSLEILLQALFATLPLKGSDSQVDNSPLEGKLGSVAQEGHHTILGGLGRLLCLLCHVAQLPGQRAPVHRPAGTGSNTDRPQTKFPQVLLVSDVCARHWLAKEFCKSRSCQVCLICSEDTV